MRIFRWFLMAFVVLLPSYLIRFKAGPLPSTILELSFGIIFLFWLFKYSRKDWPVLAENVKKHKTFFVLIGIFFISSVISIFISDMPIPSLGEWRAYFLEPILLFVVLIARSSEDIFSELVWGLALSTLSISIYCIAQEFTGWGIATPEWTALATRRTTAFFSSPNAVGLYLGPIFILLAGLLLEKFKNRSVLAGKKYFQSSWFYLSLIAFLSIAAIIYSKSRGAWVAIDISLTVLLFLAGYKKIATAVAVAGVLGVLVVLAVHPIHLDKSAQNRLTLWSYTETFLTKSPKNFIFGTGVRQFFRKIQKPYYDKTKMERLIYPHNILLNFWTEIGLLGMLSVVGILGYCFYLSYQIRKNDKIIGSTLICVLLAVIIHGLVDVPYFKNDLAMVFWILIALIFAAHRKFYLAKK